MENKMLLLRPRNFSDVINDTLGFIKLNFKPIIKVILYLVLPLLIIGSFFYSRYFNVMAAGFGPLADPEATTALMIKNGVSIFLGMIGLLFASVCLYLTVVQAFLKYEASETGVIEASDIFDGIKKDFLRFLGFVFGFTLLIAALMGVLMLLVAGLSLAGGAGLAVLLGLAFFFLFMYGAIAVIFTPFIYMRERNGIMNALSRSFYLIKGHWWQTFGVIFVVYMIVYFASMIFIIPFYAMFFTSMFHSISTGGTPSFEMSPMYTVAFMFMMCGMSIMASMLHVAVAMQYYSLVERKEGVSVMQQIENIGTSENPLA